MKATNESVDVASVEELAWMNLSESFRRACLLYHKGKETDALRIARDELPSLINQWSEISGLNGSVRRLRLMSMFVEEGRKVGESALAQKMLGAYVSTQATLVEKTREILRSGGLTGGIRLIREENAKPHESQEPLEELPDEFVGDLAALQMIR